MAGERSASMAEFRPLRQPAESYDVAILGGGLAGLTLALQLKQTRSETSVAVFEKREGPAPEAAFKVGESTVGSGAHYFAEVVGMKDHLEDAHLPKCGLRFFAPIEGNTDIARRAEVGPILFPPHVNYQIDRGRFENELAARCRRAGVDLLQGSRVADVDLGGERHSVSFTQNDQERRTSVRWVVDASGRAGLLKSKLGLSRDVGHTINSSWFRLAGGLDIEDFAPDDEEWLGRMTERGLRKFSTNHLLGRGYWIWMIPLSSGPISIGICADPRFHPYEEIDELDRALDWIRRHEPQLGQALEGREGDIEDFLRVGDFAYGCDRVYNAPDRWCLTGEAAAFADPFYSPGSDFIGYGNCFINDIVTRELQGEDVTDRAEYFEGFYFRTFDKTLDLYEDLYEVLGNAQVVMSKIAGWDVVLSHWSPTLLFVNDKLCDLEFMREVDADVDRLYRLSHRVQQLMRDWSPLEQEQDFKPVHVAVPLYRPFREGVLGLASEYSDDELRSTVAAQSVMAEAIAVGIFHRAASRIEHDLDEDTRINPYAGSLHPDRWEDDGLFEEPGLSLREAREAAEGLDSIWLEPAEPQADRAA